MSDSDQLLRVAVRSVLEELLDERGLVAAPSQSASNATPIDEKTRERIAQYALISHKPYLTRKEAAIYLNCSDRSISEWSARQADRNPFPVSAVGQDPRYKRERIDEWANREGQRRKLKIAS